MKSRQEWQVCNILTHLKHFVLVRGQQWVGHDGVYFRSGDPKVSGKVKARSYFTAETTHELAGHGLWDWMYKGQHGG